MRPFLPVVAGTLIASFALALSKGAAASDARREPAGDATDEADEADEADEPARAAVAWPVLDTRPRFAAGLDAYAGIAAQWTNGDERAHGLVGALARFRYGFVEAGATYETTDSGQAAALGEQVQEHWRAVGGFAGVWLPYRHWVDLEGAVGFSSRRYLDPDPIYGPNGFDQSVTELTLRFGVSDRVTPRTVGPRVGAALLVGVDLHRQSPVWRRESLLPSGAVEETTGNTDIGGVSIGLVVAVGLEIGGGVFEPR
jgi:hypothetical protein